MKKYTKKHCQKKKHVFNEGLCLLLWIKNQISLEIYFLFSLSSLSTSYVALFVTYNIFLLTDIIKKSSEQYIALSEFYAFVLFWYMYIDKIKKDNIPSYLFRLEYLNTNFNQSCFYNTVEYKVYSENITKTIDPLFFLIYSSVF